MKKYEYIENGYTFQRVSKKDARRAYNNGLVVIFCPVNLRPGVIRRFISQFERLTGSQEKPQHRERWGK